MSENKSEKSKEKELITLLVKAYHDEVESAMNYMSYGHSLTGFRGEFIGEELLEDVSEEFNHSEKIAEHLNVKYDYLVPNSEDFSAKQDFFVNSLSLEEKPGEKEQKEVVKAVVKAERDAIQMYSKIAELSEELGHHTTRQLAEEFLSDEEKHLDEFESFLDGME